MKRMMVFMMLGLLLLLAGCECMGGLGRDIQYSGKWIEDTADGMRK